MPALGITRSTPPHLPATRSKAVLTDSGSVTSSGIPAIRPGKPASSVRTRVSKGSPARSVAATRHPAASSPRQMPVPMAPAAPVTRATWPRNGAPATPAAPPAAAPLTAPTLTEAVPPSAAAAPHAAGPRTNLPSFACCSVRYSMRNSSSSGNPRYSPPSARMAAFTASVCSVMS